MVRRLRGLGVSGLGLEGLPKGPKVGNPKKELLWGLWVEVLELGLGFSGLCHPRSSAKATWRIVLEARNPQK